MPPHHCVKGPLVPLGMATVKELHIGEPGNHRVGEQAVNLSQDFAQCLDRHVPSPLVRVFYKSKRLGLWLSRNFFSEFSELGQGKNALHYFELLPIERG